jgi:hypothetical protein
MVKRIKAKAEESGAKPKRVTRSPAPPQKSIAHIIIEIGNKIPEADRKRLPRDLARNHDKYLYGPLTKSR